MLQGDGPLDHEEHERCNVVQKKVNPFELVECDKLIEVGVKIERAERVGRNDEREQRR